MSEINEEMEDLLCSLSELFKVFGDSTRIKILYTLLSGEMNVTELCDHLKMSQPAISQQLKVLKMNQLVKARRDGKTIFYALSDDHVKTILSIGMEHITEDD